MTYLETTEDKEVTDCEGVEEDSNQVVSIL